MGKMIPLSVPNFEGNEALYVKKAVEQGWVSTAGAYIVELEKKMAEYLHMSSAVACQSGTAAIHLAMMECGIEPKDGVIVPTLTFIAAVNPVSYLHAQPIFMDCDESLCMDPAKLESFCRLECNFESGVLYTKEGKIPIKAIVVVHVFGNLCDMEAIMEIAKEFRLKVIEDATESLGTKYSQGKYVGRYAGTIGDFGAFSYNGNKIITTGGGGMLVSNHVELLEHARYISTQAKDDPCFYVHNEVGYNYRMTNVQAAIGVAQMEMLGEFLQRKKNQYEYYREKFKNSKYGFLLPFREGTNPNYWFYSFVCNQSLSDEKMRAIVEKLAERGIQTRPVWGLIHLQKPYRYARAYRIDQAVAYGSRIINIPCSTNLTIEEMDAVILGLNQVLEEAAHED